MAIEGRSLGFWEMLEDPFTMLPHSIRLWVASESIECELEVVLEHVRQFSAQQVSQSHWIFFLERC